MRTPETLAGLAVFKFESGFPVPFRGIPFRAFPHGNGDPRSRVIPRYTVLTCPDCGQSVAIGGA
jgi:hypothetical protein